MVDAVPTVLTPSVSVTIVCVTIAPVPILHQQHALFELPIPSHLIPPFQPHGFGASYIDVSVLLQGVITAITPLMDNEKLQNLYSLLTDFPQIGVSTTQVHCFGSDMQLGQNGYHSIGKLGELLNSSLPTPISSMAAQIVDNIWTPYLVHSGAFLSHHFILVLALDPSSSLAHPLSQPPEFRKS
ncbi:hypothetical protein K438DRAFT_1999424 [Mycena galopus ATCC 62051]|nr:hypothetical protein K438DRAFT_1999424 [Mycena galopus ATCC 62051]